MAAVVPSPAEKNEDEGSPNSYFESFLTLPEEIMLMTNAAELEDAVGRCKAMVIDEPDESEEKKHLVRRLIELRLRLHDLKEAMKEGPCEQSLQDKCVVLGHHFVRQSHPKSIATNYCDRCSGVIWNAMHAWHLCSDCEYKCHTWCLNQVCRICAHLAVSEAPELEFSVCPEEATGLAAQNYRCAECLTHTGFGESILEPRRCDYNGKYYCPTCHWNSSAIIPARVLNNWDFSERRVCRDSKQRLRYLSKLPIINLQEFNPVLFGSIEELITVKNARHQMLLMKKYLTSCRVALETGITWQLQGRLHLVENEDMLSLQDLIDLKSGVLIPLIEKVMESFVKHITKDCKVCFGQGFICELCDDNSVIFPFSKDTISCPVCASVNHFLCWEQNQRNCMKCLRKQKRLLEES